MNRRTAVLPALLACLIGLAACSAGEGAPNIGYVEADWVYVAAPEAGWIVEQPVRAGTTISSGDLLFRLDTTAQEAVLAEAEARMRQSDAQARNIATGARAAEIRALEARLAEAEARLVQARMDHDRIVPLVELGLEPKARGDRVTSDVAMAEAAVEALKQDIAVARQAGRPAEREAADAATASARAAMASAAYRLSQRQVTAGMSARVEEVFLEAGEYATPGAPVLALLPEDGLKIRFFVPQAGLSTIELGEPVRVSADGLDAPLEAHISFISADAEFTPPVIYSRDAREKLVFLVEARVPAASPLKPGLPVEVVW